MAKILVAFFNCMNDPENPNAMEAFKAKIEKINTMKEAGLLSEEEFKSMKEKPLSDIL